MSGHVERINRTISSSQRIPRKERESVTIHARCDTHACENTHIWRCRGKGEGEGGGGGVEGTFAWWTSLSARISSEHRRELIQFERICT